MSDDRASRLRERRRSSKTRTPESTQSSSEEDDATGDTEREADQAPDGSDAATTGDGSVKDEQVGTYMYLPERQKRELKRVFNVTKAQYEYEFDEEFEKNRHFYPLLVQFGIESLDGASPTEVRDLLEELHGE